MKQWYWHRLKECISKMFTTALHSMAKWGAQLCTRQINTRIGTFFIQAEGAARQNKCQRNGQHCANTKEKVLDGVKFSKTFTQLSQQGIKSKMSTIVFHTTEKWGLSYAHDK